MNKEAIGALKGAFLLKIQPLVDSVAVENLDPDDPVLRMFTPTIIAEHIERYCAVLSISEKDPEEITIVDIASGRGYGSSILRKEFGQEATILGIELNTKYSKKSREKYGNTPVTADARRLPIMDGSADIVTGFEIIEHLPKESQAGMMLEVARVLKEDGIALISFPERYSYRTDKEGKVVRSGPFSNPHHQYEPGGEEMENLAENCGLEVVGRYGQLWVNKKGLEIARSISRILPAWPVYAWSFKRDAEPRKKSGLKTGEKVPLTHILVLKKSNNNSSDRLV